MAHLSAAKAKHILLHLPKTLQAELEANVEQQEHHSQLCQMPHSLHVLDDPQGMRANESTASLSAPKKPQLPLSAIFFYSIHTITGVLVITLSASRGGN